MSDDFKCIVKDCQNHKSQGRFIGDLCTPCHEFITTGKGTHSQAYRNALKVQNPELLRYKRINQEYKEAITNYVNTEKKRNNLLKLFESISTDT